MDSCACSLVLFFDPSRLSQIQICPEEFLTPAPSTIFNRIHIAHLTAHHGGV